MLVTVLTSTLPEREELLAEAAASVRAQTHTEVEHLMAVDRTRMGAGPVLNRLLEEARGEYVMVLDDDDLLDPVHLERLVPWCRDHDVVYSLPRVEGGEFTQYAEPFDAARLALRNVVSHNALMRTGLVRELGGWNPVRWFDWDLFRRLEHAGAEFKQVFEQTWTYRLGHAYGNWSHGTLAGAP